MNYYVPIINKAPDGIYRVKIQFDVEASGEISNLKILEDPGYGTAQEVRRVMAKSPNWVPARENGKAINSRIRQSIAFVVK